MEKIYTRNVDVYQLPMRYIEEAEQRPTFEELLRALGEIEDETLLKGKRISFKILEDREDYIVGLVATNRDSNIPPVRRAELRRIEPLDIDEGDGLAFANVFYYDLSRKIILYEVNKNGSVLPHFIDFVYRKLRDRFHRTYTINPRVVLKRDENNRLLKINRKTRIEVEVAHPKRIIDDQIERDWSFLDFFKFGADIDSTKLKIEFSVDARSGDSLNERKSQDIIDEIKTVMDIERAEVNHLKVYGYVDDGIDTTVQQVDLVADRLKGQIQLREPRVASNLLEGQRLSEIKNLYSRIEDELFATFG